MKRAVIAMSGGVDSSVAAYLLRKNGYDTVGATMKLLPEDIKDVSSEINDARRSAENTGIPFFVFDFCNEFENYVIKDFSASYKNGLTPNPCITCNKHIKFDLMLKKADEMGIEFLATGHYARIEFCEETGRYLLKKARFEDKDQSYVLYNLKQEQLRRIIFPLGDLSKDEVRELAAATGFGNAAKSDSQDICFVPDGDYAAFLERHCGYRSIPGFFTDTAGNRIAPHKGIIHYTVGQRKGLGIALGEPCYVVKKDAVTNDVVLGKNQDLFSDTLFCSDVNLISVPRLEAPMKVKAKVRYKHKESEAVIYPLPDNRIKVCFSVAQRAISPGQSVVFYDGEYVVGGGIIE